jgi:hypothetical protein
MNKTNKERLKQSELAYKSIKYPTMPTELMATTMHSDKDTNSLTRCVLDWLKFEGWQAERISTTGKYIDSREQFTDVLGRTRTIGSGKFIPGQGTKGSADISATIGVKVNGITLGISVKIEIKFGKDRQSDAQKRYQEQIEKAGGVYIIVKTFDGFLDWYDQFINQ